MGRRWMRIGAVVAAGGTMLQFGGCLKSWWGQIATDMALSAAYEFVLDNDAVFDLFQDDFGTDVQFDDRFANDPIRDEPNDDTQTLVDDLAGR